MTVKLLLDRKREGGELAPDDIRALVAGYVRGDVPDYQMSAFAMAVCCRGLTDAETLALTYAMRDSGACLDWRGLSAPTADKHSTGGVGDKLSLLVQPLAAACGLAVPSLTGRGLGLTGGTADKMESIPGYTAGLSLDAYRRVVAQCGCSLAMQTPEIAPADRKLYALRDVTGTVPSLPLIVASILSKKLAEGAETLVFDVKCGRGAFMRTRADAAALARALVSVAQGAGRRAVALVTDMDAPLGFAVGNVLEVAEAVDALRPAADGAAPLLPSRPARDVIDLSLDLAARMVALARSMPLDDARAACAARLADGSAWRKFAEMVALHGGDLAALRLPRPAAAVRAETPAGAVPDAPQYVAAIDAEKIARAAFALGAGRAKASDAIDPAAGVLLHVTRGDAVRAGAVLADLFTETRPDALPQAAALVREAVAFAPAPPPDTPRVLEVVA